MDLKLRYVALPAFAVALSIPASAAVVIDDFTQGATSLAINGTTGFQESQQTSSAIPGTQRDVLLTVTSNPFQRNATFDIVPTQGMSFYASGPGIVGSVALDYDGVDTEGNDGVQTAGPGMNLNLSGQNAIRLNFAFADEGLQIRVDAYTVGGGHSFATSSVGAGVSTSTNIDLALSSFSTVSGGGVNFADTDRLVFTFSGNGPASDFALSNITAVPEPASMAALLVGAAGLIARRRRRK